MLDRQIQVKKRQVQSASKYFKMVLLIFAFGCDSDAIAQPKPNWSRFDRVTVTQMLNRGEYVILFGNPTYNTEGKLLHHNLQSSRLSDKLTLSRAKLFYLAYGSGDTVANDLMEMTLKTYSPILVLLHRDREPEYFSNDDLEEFARALDGIIATMRRGK